MRGHGVVVRIPYTHIITCLQPLLLYPIASSFRSMAPASLVLNKTVNSANNSNEMYPFLFFVIKWIQTRSHFFVAKKYYNLINN